MKILLLKKREKWERRERDREKHTRQRERDQRRKGERGRISPLHSSTLCPLVSLVSMYSSRIVLCACYLCYYIAKNSNVDAENATSRVAGKPGAEKGGRRAIS